jgi:hypothetical protein
MTALHPVASRLPDRKVVRCPGQGAASARAMTIEQGFPSPDQPDKGRTATYRAGSRRELWLRALCATVGGSRGEPLCYRRWQPRGAIVLPSVAAAGSHLGNLG